MGIFQRKSRLSSRERRERAPEKSQEPDNQEKADRRNFVRRKAGKPPTRRGSSCLHCRVAAASAGTAPSRTREALREAFRRAAETPTGRGLRRFQDAHRHAVRRAYQALLSIDDHDM